MSGKLNEQAERIQVDHGEPATGEVERSSSDPRGLGAPTLADALAACNTGFEQEVVEAYIEAALFKVRRPG